jgi:hypothetical protein
VKYKRKKHWNTFIKLISNSKWRQIKLLKSEHDSGICAGLPGTRTVFIITVKIIKRARV